MSKIINVKIDKSNTKLQKIRYYENYIHKKHKISLTSIPIYTLSQYYQEMGAQRSIRMLERSQQQYRDCEYVDYEAIRLQIFD